MHRFAPRFCWLVKLSSKRNLGLYDSKDKADAAVTLHKELGYPNAKVVRI